MSTLIHTTPNFHETVEKTLVVQPFPGFDDAVQSAFWLAAMQVSLDRDEMARRFPANTEWEITSEGGIAVRMVNDTGATSVPGTIVSTSKKLHIAGDAASQLSALALTGLTVANSDLGVLYWTITLPTDLATVTLYSDAAKTVKVAEGALENNDGGTITLTESGSSGLSGTVDIVASAVTDTTAGNTITSGVTKGVDATAANGTDAIGVVYDIGDDGDHIFVVVAGAADVLLKDSGGAPHGGWIYVSDTAGRAASALAKGTSTVERQIGYALARVEAGTDQLVRTALSLR